MTQGEPRSFSADVDFQPHAFDPARNPELFYSVRTRRLCAFLIDAIVVTIPIAFAAIFILLFGFVTFGLGWTLFWFLSPGTVVWAVLYYGFTLGGPYSATWGQRMMGIEMRLWYGAPCYFLLGAVHVILYWVSVATLTPFIVLISLFNGRKRLLHDFLLGTVVVNSAALRAGYPPR
jgi:uncharacterized RDD family membrane protein YckC